MTSTSGLLREVARPQVQADTSISGRVVPSAVREAEVGIDLDHEIRLDWACRPYRGWLALHSAPARSSSRPVGSAPRAVDQGSSSAV